MVRYFGRFGTSLTGLPGGRVVEVGGEHVCHDAPDFRIDNDVAVHHADGTLDADGYPADVCTRNDFRTAALVGQVIDVVGFLDHLGQWRYGTTPVCRVDAGDGAGRDRRRVARPGLPAPGEIRRRGDRCDRRRRVRGRRPEAP